MSVICYKQFQFSVVSEVLMLKLYTTRYLTLKNPTQTVVHSLIWGLKHVNMPW